MSGSRITITEVLARHTPKLLAIPGVVGTGEGEKNGVPCIVVFLLETGVSLPDSIEGFAVVGRFVGEVRPI